MIVTKPEYTTTCHPGGLILMEHWKVNDAFHREDGPAFISWYRNGKIESQEWFRNGSYYREDDLPCIMEYNVSGALESEEWCNKKAGLHRKNGPARILYEDGKTTHEGWHHNDKYHRIDGPASIDYREDGTVNRIEWWLKGERYDSIEKWLEDTPLELDGKVEIKLTYL